MGCCVRILFLTPYVPSPRAGGEKFTLLLLEKLSARHQIDLVYYKYAKDSFYNVPDENVRVLKVCKNSTVVKLWNALKLPFFFPTFTIRFSLRLLFFIKRAMKKRKYDLIYLDHSQMALYGLFFKNTPKILMSHDVMLQRFNKSGSFVSRWVNFTEKKVMSAPELTVWTFSEKDKALIHDFYGLDSRVTSFFLDSTIVNAEPRKNSDEFIFFGKWKRADNFDGLHWFFENVYPKLPEKWSFVIIGIGLPADFEKKLQSYPNVKYLGFVDNPYEIIADAKALIAPIFSGAGVKVKVYEALACGIPVIGNDAAFEGISPRWKDFMLHADSAADYVRVMSSLSFSLSQKIQFHKEFVAVDGEKPLVTFLNERGRE